MAWAASAWSSRHRADYRICVARQTMKSLAEANNEQMIYFSH
jgi:hypothetical protein